MHQITTNKVKHVINAGGAGGAFRSIFVSYAVIISVLVLRADLYFESAPLFDRQEALVGFW